MKQGFGAVYARVFNEKGEDLDLRLRRFVYTHSEKADDVCVIVAESMDPMFPDHPDLQEGKALKMVWGYIGGEQSQPRKVYIWDIKVRFGQNGVELTLECLDGLAYAKMKTSTAVRTNVTAEDIAKQIADDNGLKVVTEFGREINTGRRQVIYQEPGSLSPYSEAIDNTAVVKQHFIRHEFLTQGNKSDVEMLQQAVALEPDGPYDVVGRDDDLIIRKRDYSKKPIRALTYKGEDGHLIEFVPETKNRGTAAAQEVEMKGWDKDNKSFYQGSVDESTDKNVRLGEELEPSKQENATLGDINGNSPGAPPLEKEKAKGTNMDFEIFKLNTESPALRVENRNYRPAKLMGNSIGGIQITKENEKVQVGYTQAIDNTAVLLKTYRVPQKKTTIETPEAPPNAGPIGNTERAKAAEEKNPGTVVMIGDPTIMSGEIISIINASKKYSGNYYISRAEHDVDFQAGYLLTLQVSRNGSNPVEGSRGKTKASDYGVKVNKGLGTQKSTNRKFVKKEENK